MNYLILGTGTDIGKSFLVENLCRIWPNTTAIKPVCTGFRDDDKNSDPARILTALNQEISKKNLDKISPWRFEEACSPHFVKEKISFLEVVKFCEQKISENKNKTLLIEAAGGVMTPINNQKTFLDLAEKLKIPVFLVCGNYLGAISHTLSAVEKIIINELDKSKFSITKTIEAFSKSKSTTMHEFLRESS